MQVFDGRVMNGERGKIRAGDLRRHVLLPKALHDPAIDLVLAVGAKQSGTQFHKHDTKSKVVWNGVLGQGERLQRRR